jgi:hypothetical protein
MITIIIIIIGYGLYVDFGTSVVTGRRVKLELELEHVLQENYM